MSVIKFADPKADNITVTIKLSIDDIAMVNKFIVCNQHNSNTHGR